jgi:hypothetical protein
MLYLEGDKLDKYDEIRRKILDIIYSNDLESSVEILQTIKYEPAIAYCLAVCFSEIPYIWGILIPFFIGKIDFEQRTTLRRTFLKCIISHDSNFNDVIQLLYEFPELPSKIRADRSYLIHALKSESYRFVIYLCDSLGLKFEPSDLSITSASNKAISLDTSKIICEKIEISTDIFQKALEVAINFANYPMVSLLLEKKAVLDATLWSKLHSKLVFSINRTTREEEHVYRKYMFEFAGKVI